MTGRADGRGLRAVVLLAVLAGLVGPIAAGLGYTGLAAFGGLEGRAGTDDWRAPWLALAALPGLWSSIVITLWTGFAATALSLGLALGLLGLWHARGARTRWLHVLTPLLATPHSALAIGLAFLIAPSGWIVRLFSPWATGWVLPPDIATVHDPLGLALIAGLTAKELPFLLLVAATALGQIPVAQRMATGRSLGYGPGQVWRRIVIPELYRLIRLPVAVVLAFSLSVVDMAILLGPSNPPTLAVAMTRWFMAADLALFAPASAAALVLAGLVVAAILLWSGVIGSAGLVLRHVLRQGRRHRAPTPAFLLAGPALLVLGGGALSLLALGVWSVARRWRFPQVLPDGWTLSAWTGSRAVWGGILGETALVAGVASGLSLLFAILWLEGETRGHFARARWAEALIYLPLLVPQVAFLFGLHIVFLHLGVGGDRVAVVWVHAIFVFPYVMLSLSDPWRALDPRLMRTAAALGASPLRQLLAVRLPCLARPVLIALSIGFAVSVAQYLPTLFMGAGRVNTLTTEAVSLASGGDRRIAGVLAVLQSVLPLVAYGLALAVPALILGGQRGQAGDVA